MIENESLRNLYKIRKAGRGSIVHRWFSLVKTDSEASHECKIYSYYLLVDHYYYR